MSDEWTHDEVGLSPRPSSDRRSELPSSWSRRVRALVALVAVGAVAAGASLVPRFVSNSAETGSIGLDGGTACQVALPASWLKATHRQLPASPLGLNPFAVASNGRAYFAAVEAAAWSGVVEVNAATGVAHRIEEFTPPTETVTPTGSTGHTSVNVLSGSFDGRWLVWEQERQLQGLATATTLMAWDSVSGDIWSIAGPFSAAVPVAQDPAPEAGLLAWGGSSAGKSATIHFQLYSLRDRRSKAVREAPRQNSFGGAFFWHHALLFDVGGGLAKQKSWHLEAFSVTTGDPTAVPAALRTLRGLETVGADAQYAYGVRRSEGSPSSPNRPVQFTILILGPEAREMSKLTGFQARLLTEVSLFGHYLAWQVWPTSSSTFVSVADLASAAWVRFPGVVSGQRGPEIFGGLGGGSTLLTLGADGATDSYGSSVAVLHLTRLTSLVCPR
ncbi:MAG TPA: hypothetical protein VNH38_07640 [Candidatus Dormibacteraeota bacterium]|nr:hypothetical protein [Candidatus Dormibacteraeota bacterium]